MTKTVTKPAVAVRHVARVQQKAATFYAFVDGARPTQGKHLYAHTHAALTFLGLLSGGEARRQAAEALMGHRAVEYHIGRENLAAGKDTVRLTRKGAKSFKAREERGMVDLDMVKAFLAAISKGRGDVAYSINKEHLHPVRNTPIH